MYALLRRTAAAVVGGAASVALLACTTTAAPASGGESDHLDVGSVKGLSLGCEDIRDGYPDAAKYAGEGPHTIAIFAKDLVSDAGATGTGGQQEYQLANREISDGLLAIPDSPRDVALLACGDTQPGDEQLNVCSYESILGTGGRPREIPLYSQRYTFTVYELRTGRVVDTLQLESQMRQPAASCPLTLGGGSKIYAKAQPYELDDLLKDIVTSPAG